MLAPAGASRGIVPRESESESESEIESESESERERARERERERERDGMDEWIDRLNGTKGVPIFE